MIEEIVADYENDVLVSKALSLMYVVNAEKLDENKKPYFLKIISRFSGIVEKTTNKKLWVISLILEINKNELYSFDDLNIFGDEIKQAVIEISSDTIKSDLAKIFMEVKNELE